MAQGLTSVSRDRAVPRKVKPADKWVARFAWNERFAHWWTVSMFLTALITGVIMGPDAESGPMMQAHIASVILLGVGILLALLGGPRRILRSMRQLFVFDRHDLAWLSERARRPFAMKLHAQWGKFNLGQKLAAWAVSVSFSVLIYTGIRSYQTGNDLAGPHNTAVVVTVVLIGAHFVMAVINPSTRPALAGMVLGRVRRTWARKHHGAWLDELDRTTTSETPQ